MYVWSAFSALYINRLWLLPILLVVSRKQKFPCPRLRMRIWPREPGSAVPAPACTFSTLRLKLVINSRIPPDSRDGVRLLIQTIYGMMGSIPSLSGLAIWYRWRSRPKFYRHRASSPQSISSNRCCLGRSPWANYYEHICSHTL